MAKRYNLTFNFFDTREQAKAFCDKENAKKTEHKFVVWYYY